MFLHFPCMKSFNFNSHLALVAEKSATDRERVSSSKFDDFGMNFDLGRISIFSAIISQKVLNRFSSNFLTKYLLCLSPG